MSKKLNFPKMEEISNIQLSLVMIILICTIIFFVYLRKEYFNSENNSNNYEDEMNNLNINNMINEEYIKESLSVIRKYVENPEKYKHNKKKILNQISMLESMV